MERRQEKVDDMRNACRPGGRFFCLLVMVAVAWMTAAAQIQSSGPAMTQVTDTVYRADGTAAQGSVLLAWPPFTTADGKAVAAGSLSVKLGSGGAFTASLAPNTGAQPAGVFYKVVYQLVGQEPSTEFWVVPATGSTTIGAVRAKLMPPTIAAQVLTRDVAESNYVHVNGTQTINGAVTFASSPTVPTPQNTGDAASKGYVDEVATREGNLSSPSAIGSEQPNAGAFTTLAANSLNTIVYVQCPSCTDWGAAITSAMATCPSISISSNTYKSCKMVLPTVNAGPWATLVDIVSPAVSLEGQGSEATTFSCTALECLRVETSPWNIAQGGIYKGFQIVGNGSASQNLFHLRDRIGAALEDLILDGASGTGSSCLWMEAYRNWVERSSLNRVKFGYGCANAWTISADVGNTANCPTIGTYCSA
ncbi:MAG TPA: hypothetical protein VE779_16470, partial [Candidatus Angelobacter sp.]|nr:hypothetical protein [Candidatus Angelobacter sp.]